VWYSGEPIDVPVSHAKNIRWFICHAVTIVLNMWDTLCVVLIGCREERDAALPCFPSPPCAPRPTLKEVALSPKCLLS
jgi:hypothetical protein